MTVETLLKKFQEQGGEIKETGKTLKFYAPDDLDTALKEEVVDRLKEIKTFYLSTEAKDKEVKYWEGLPLSKLADQKIAIKIKSAEKGPSVCIFREIFLNYILNCPLKPKCPIDNSVTLRLAHNDILKK